MPVLQHVWPSALLSQSFASDFQWLLIRPLFGSFWFLMWWKQCSSCLSLTSVGEWKVWSAPPASVPTSFILFHFCLSAFFFFFFYLTIKRQPERDGLKFAALLCVTLFPPFCCSLYTANSQPTPNWKKYERVTCNRILNPSMKALTSGSVFLLRLLSRGTWVI